MNRALFVTGHLKFENFDLSITIFQKYLGRLLHSASAVQYFMYPLLILYDTIKSIINAIKKGIRKPLIANTMSG